MADDAELAPTLDATDIDVLEAIGTRRSVAAGEYLYREGDSAYEFYVVLSGAVDILVGSDEGQRLIIRHGPGKFTGELNLLTGLRVFVSARVSESGEVVAVPRAALRRVMATNPKFGDTILAAFIARRALLLRDAASSIRLIGSRFSPESMRLREFLARTRIPHQWLEPNRDGTAEAVMTSFGLTPADLPAVITTGSVLRRPTPGALADYLGLTAGSLPERCFDLVVVGGGPAGLAASVYGASEGLRTLGLDMIAPGGQAGASSRIENYLGFPMGISGGDLTHRAFIQAEKFGAYLTAPCAATSLRESAGHLVIALSDGSEVAGRAVIAATGATYRRLDAARLEDFESKGVYYAATELEARACAAAPVVVAGGGNSAGQAALFLAGCGSPVTIVIRGPDLVRSMSRYLVDRIEADARIKIRANTAIVAVDGDQTLRSVTVATSGETTTLHCVALFSFIGAEPASQWLCDCAALDDRGFVLTDRSLADADLGDRWSVLGRSPLPFETSYPGLFAVGDMRSGSTKRVASAVGEGSAAVGSVHEYLAFAH
jgi:thioredoxin reductase (NADPH)